jgi:hypothetical protein
LVSILEIGLFLRMVLGLAKLAGFYSQAKPHASATVPQVRNLASSKYHKISALLSHRLGEIHDS